MPRTLRVKAAPFPASLTIIPLGTNVGTNAEVHKETILDRLVHKQSEILVIVEVPLLRLGLMCVPEDVGLQFTLAEIGLA